MGNLTDALWPMSDEAVLEVATGDQTRIPGVAGGRESSASNGPRDLALYGQRFAPRHFGTATLARWNVGECQHPRFTAPASPSPFADVSVNAVRGITRGKDPIPKPFDATMRGLIELEPAAWLRFLHVDIADPSLVRVVDSNLSNISTISAEADKVLWIAEPEPWIEHLELQAARDAQLPERVLWYSTMMRHRLKVPVHSTIILFRPAADGPELTSVFEHRDHHGDVYTSFRYSVVRVWQLEVEEVLNAGLSILPLAPVSNVGLEQLPGVLMAISRRLEQEASPDQAAMLWNATKVTMGLRYPKEQVEGLIEGVSAMLFGINGIEESSIYQDILQKGEAKGEARGESRGRVEGRVQGLVEEARGNLLRLGLRKLGQPAGHVEAELAAIGDLDRLHDLIDRILDVTTWDELLSPIAP